MYYSTIVHVLGDSKSQRASKVYLILVQYWYLILVQYWFKSYGDFSEWVDFAYWWSFIWKDLRLQPAQQACFSLQVNP